MVKKEGEKGLVNPRWRKCEVENITCPQCGGMLIPGFTPSPTKILYSYCSRCNDYFVGE